MLIKREFTIKQFKFKIICLGNVNIKYLQESII